MLLQWTQCTLYAHENVHVVINAYGDQPIVFKESKWILRDLEDETISCSLEKPKKQQEHLLIKQGRT